MTPINMLGTWVYLKCLWRKTNSPRPLNYLAGIYGMLKTVIQWPQIPVYYIHGESNTAQKYYHI